MLDDERVGFEDRFADPFGDTAFGGEASEVVDRAEDVESAGFAELEVVRTVARGDVHAAGAGVHGDKIGGEDRRGAIEERMTRDGAFEIGAGKFLRLALRLPSGFGGEGGNAVGGHDQRARLSVFGEALREVLVFWADGDGEVRREGPRGGGPDNHGGAGWEIFALGDVERNVDGGGLFVFVFDFGFGKGGLRAIGPKDGAFAPVNEVLFDEDGEGAEDVGFVDWIERQVGVFPVAEDTEAAELLALQVDVFAGVGLGALADFDGSEAGLFFDHFEFDGESVAVPTGDEGRTETGHGL